MGSDGGSITRAKSIIVSSASQHKDALTSASKVSDQYQYQVSRLSNSTLELPLMSDYKGFLYNKIDLLEYLLSKKKNAEDPSTLQSEFQHLNSLKDTVELKNIRIMDSSDIVGDDVLNSKLECVSTGDTLTLSKKVIFFIKCGCVLPLSNLLNTLSLKETNALTNLKILNNDTQTLEKPFMFSHDNDLAINCPSCGSTDNFEHSIVVLNPNTNNDLAYNEARHKHCNDNLKQHFNGSIIKVKKSKTKKPNKVTKKQ